DYKRNKALPFLANLAGARGHAGKYRKEPSENAYIRFLKAKARQKRATLQSAARNEWSNRLV
ncbi:MAG: hypothetical protein ACN6OD_18565, partial [Alcaligenes sp.]